MFTFQFLNRILTLWIVILSSVKSYFDSHAHLHVYHRDPAVYQSILAHIQQSKSKGELHILDVGCGDGSFIESAIMTGLTGRFIGIDLSWSMITMANKKLKTKTVQLLVADAFNIPLKEDIKFDIIHIDSVLHHLIGKTRSQSMQMVERLLKKLITLLSKDGIFVVEEMYYRSYISPRITSTIIFHGLKILNYLHFDISSIVREFQPGLEVNFLYDEDLERSLNAYGRSVLIKKVPSKIPRLYRLFMLKDLGRICYLLPTTGDHRSDEIT